MTKLLRPLATYFAVLSAGLVCPRAWGGFANYNSILIGERAAGMGGAFTALTDDPAACSFYNPATLARMEGASLSATANIYAKFDTKFGSQKDFSSAPLRVNQGSIVPIPASSGSVYTFGNFAAGLSIVLPNHDRYTGEVRSTADSNSILNLRDESLWVGGTVALNATEKTALGLTMYYTSRTFTRSVTDQVTSGGTTTVTNEETIFTNNGLIYILGAWHRFHPNWSTGVSVRFPYLEVSGRGSYYRNQVASGAGSSDSVNRNNLRSDTDIPWKLSWGVAFEEARKLALSMDFNYYGKAEYDPLIDPAISDRIRHRAIGNISVGGEYFLRDWLAWRAGAYTNFSSHPEIDRGLNRRQGDHIDMWGFSTNFAIFTSRQSRVTLGGYYTGGKGDSTQLIADQYQRITKSVQMFSFLVGTAFQF